MDHIQLVIDPFEVPVEDLDGKGNGLATPSTFPGVDPAVGFFDGIWIRRGFDGIPVPIA